MKWAERELASYKAAEITHGGHSANLPSAGYVKFWLLVLPFFWWPGASGGEAGACRREENGARGAFQLGLHCPRALPSQSEGFNFLHFSRLLSSRVHSSFTCLLLDTWDLPLATTRQARSASTVQSPSLGTRLVREATGQKGAQGAPKQVLQAPRRLRPPSGSAQGIGWGGGVAPGLGWQASGEGHLLGDAPLQLLLRPYPGSDP